MVARVAIILGFCFLLGACGSTDDCAFTAKCSCEDPTFGPSHPAICSCADPIFGPSHPALCSVDAANEGNGAADAGPANTEDGKVEANGPGADGPDAQDVDGSIADGGTGIESSSGLQDADAAPADATGTVCDPTSLPSVSPCVIDEQYGAFVSPLGNDAAGVGTRAAPLRTIGAALIRVHDAGKRVYACDNGTGYAEAITVSAGFDGVALFGGFACTDWSYSTSRKVVVRAPAGAALVVRGVTGVVLENFELQGGNGTGPGTSSFGATIDSAMGVVMRRVRIAAGTGAAGMDGVDGSAGNAGAMADATQSGLAATCSSNSGGQLGGLWATASMCGSAGGSGGVSSFSSASKGFPGTPRAGVTPPGVDNGGPDGMPGVAGSPGNAGTPGASVSGAGTFLPIGYLAAGPAGSGTPGLVGQGGGGGGSSAVPPQFMNCLGASGGAGGMGGCGGMPGTGGQGGGASVALLMWASRVTLDTCDLFAGMGGAGGNGGNGGLGGTGQDGAIGGYGLISPEGLGTIPQGGQGGPGGHGGAGGPGAGGNGGPSYALVFSGPPPTRTATTLLPFRGGAAGSGGSAPASETAGAVVFAPAGTTGLSAMEFAVVP